MERIELNEEYSGRRALAAILLLVLGLGMIGYAIYQMLTPQTEWITIEAHSSAGVSCAQEFHLLYRPEGRSAAADRKAVTELYTQLCRRAYEDFHSMEGFEGVNNIFAINRHPNEALEVDGALYKALAAVERSGSRLIYLGPVYERYESIVFCEDDGQLVDYDPRLNQEIARDYGELAGYAADPRSVRVELLGENRVRLYVSEAYLDYARREGVERFIDFSWTRNAFIADFLAEELIARGYTNGALSSYDGFVRNLDGSGRDYSLQLYDRRGSSVYVAAVMDYRGPMSIVSLWDYPISGLDEYRFYVPDSGEVRTPYLDIADGVCRNALPTLTGYARDRGCGEILLAMAPLYIADTLDSGALEDLATEGIQSIRCEDEVIYPTEAGVSLHGLYEQAGMRYTVASANK